MYDDKGEKVIDKKLGELKELLAKKEIIFKADEKAKDRTDFRLPCRNDGKDLCER